ncbi:MAG TPA: ABC transporter ATP-binding protein [Acidimicrobiales bacterium]|nr:ABC transporter ATP-binding protein [Acidimicrobiales bacterium]
MAGSMGHGGWGMMRSLRRDQDLQNHRIQRATLRRMVQFARPYRGQLLIFMAVVVLDALVVVVNPLILRRIINLATAHTGADTIVALAFLAVLLAVADAGLTLTERRIAAAIGEYLIYDMRAKVFGHVQAMPISFFSRTQTGALISRLNNDIIGAQQAFTDLLSNIVGNAVMVLLVLVTMAFLSWQITLVALLLVPMFLIPAKSLGPRLGRLFRQGMGLNAEMNTMMQERFNVSGAMLVKLFGRPDEERAAFDQRAAGVRDIGIKQATYQRMFFVGLSLTAALATAFAYGFGGVAVVNHAMSLGTVVALTLYLARLFAPLLQLSNAQVDLTSAVVSFERVFEVLDIDPMIKEAPDATPIPSGPATVELRDVRFSYPTAEEVSIASLEAVATLERTGRAEVLRGISFTVEPGTVVALVGPSGAGKTTISSLIPRLYDPTAGVVLINGRELRAATTASIVDTVGVVTQDAHLFHDSLRANLLYARPEATETQLEAALRSAQILELVESLPNGLETIVGERGYRLSGGEKQRIAIARLLLKAPRVVVLDEATAHLDAESEAAVQRALDATLEGRTSIVIAHRLSTIRNADEILVVARGELVDRGTHEELFARGGLYRDLYETQFATQGHDAAATETHA